MQYHVAIAQVTERISCANPFSHLNAVRQIAQGERNDLLIPSQSEIS